jgi:hypothetical protein
MPKTKEGQQLHDLVAEAIDRRRAAPRLSPTAIAEEVLGKLDAEETSHPTVWVGCNLHVRQIARGQLAKRFDPIAGDEDEGEEDGDDQPELPELFEGLQWRYPEAPKGSVKRSPDQGYVLRDLMSQEDVRWNVKRLRSEAAAKFEHARTLEAWNEERTRPHG